MTKREECIAALFTRATALEDCAESVRFDAGQGIGLTREAAQKIASRFESNARMMRSEAMHYTEKADRYNTRWFARRTRELRREKAKA